MHADLPHLGRQAQDRRLPVHHPRAEPRRGAPRRRDRVRGGRHPRPHRGGQRGPGPRPPVPAPRRAGPGAGAAARPRRRWRRTRPPSRSGSCWPSSATTGPSCSSGPGLVVGSRADLAEPDIDFDGPRIAAVTGEGLRPLVGRMADAVRGARGRAPEADAFVVHRPVAEGFRIERDDGGAWTVLGRQAERAVALSDLTNLEALDEAQRRLRALGRGQGPGPGRGPGRRHRAHRPPGLRLRGRPVIVVAKIGTSSITDRRRRDRRAGGRQVLRRGGRAAGAGPPGGGRHLGGHRRRAAGARPRAATGPGTRSPSRPSRRSARAASCGSTTSALATHGLVGGQVLLAPLDFVHPPAVPARPGHPRPAARAGRGAGGQRERRHRRRRDPLRRQRPAGGAGGPPARRRPARAAHRCARAAHRRSPARRVGLAHRGDRGGRPRAGGPRRWGGLGPGERRAWRRSWRRPRSPPGRACGR